jgi:hypothetical protein
MAFNVGRKTLLLLVEHRQFKELMLVIRSLRRTGGKLPLFGRTLSPQWRTTRQEVLVTESLMTSTLIARSIKRGDLNITSRVGVKQVLPRFPKVSESLSLQQLKI